MRACTTVAWLGRCVVVVAFSFLFFPRVNFTPLYSVSGKYYEFLVWWFSFVNIVYKYGLCLLFLIYQVFWELLVVVVALLCTYGSIMTVSDTT